MKRLILQNLITWKYKKNRKPLIIKGVRQTGKTFILKKFGESHFPTYHYVNFENNHKFANLFKENFDPKRIVNDLSFILDKPIDIKNDLLLFDEIQACPAALTSLKYFSEQLPELALCCAGSLLGLHLGESSFPVGKVDFFHMKPMCFVEFLEATGDHKSLDILNQCVQTTSIPNIVHEHLWQQLKIYFVTGGLPEVVQTYVDNQKDLYTAFTLVRQKQNEIIYGYYSDIAKHSGKVNAMHIDRVWRAIPTQLAQSQNGTAKRFQFKEIIPGADRYNRLANVIDWLLAAELIIKIPIIEHAELPLTAYTKESHFKLYLFDVGILGALSDLPPKSILDYEYGTYKGYFAENFVASEFMANDILNLKSWQQNRAEIEFLYLLEDQIIPIEVKSGWITRSQSLKNYTEKYHPTFRVTFSAKPLYIDLKNHGCHYPLYMVHWFPLKVTQRL
ncbi:MAG: ATP-binding protein [Gammaproteobacteria bacterium]|nr:ATP-binding protein [Gammaproteobacteria bacterium]